MKPKIIEWLSQALQQLQQNGDLPADLKPHIQVEPTRDKAHGDFAANIALTLAKSVQQNPRQLAKKIVAQLPKSPQIKQVTIAGPGFINFFLAETALTAIVPEILAQGKTFGHQHVGAGQRVHLEFVSSNPTGPLHVGHGRGAAYGATVANLLETQGFQVHREYYVNDAGRQMDILAVSIWIRYLQELGLDAPFPSNGYHGEYVTHIARELKVNFKEDFKFPLQTIFQDLPKDAHEDGTGDKEIYIDAVIERAQSLLGTKNFQLIHEFGLNNILADIRQDLAEFGVTFQQWFQESSLIRGGSLTRALAELETAGTLFEKDGATWFRATQFGDEKDRVVIRENGRPTYFAADMAYHYNKFERGFDQMIDIFGSDHHGYAPRVKGFLHATHAAPEKLTILLVQFAILYRGKEKVPMSTRSGSFVTLRELREEVGNDAARFFYIMRKPEQHLDFDLELAKSQSNDNPVYYIQYAHARICSVFRQLEAKHLSWDQNNGLQNLIKLNATHEQDLIKHLSQWPDTLATAALNYEPHILAHFLQELANDFHTYYNAQQFLVEDNSLRDARLALITATRQVLANGLQLLGVSAPEVM